MELDSPLLTDRAAEAARSLLDLRFGRYLPRHLWPEYDGDTDFDDWDAARRRIAAEYASTVWDEGVRLLDRGAGYAAVTALLDRLRGHRSRIDNKVAQAEAELSMLEYAAEAIRIEAGEATTGASIGSSLNRGREQRERPWWRWQQEGDDYVLVIPGLFPVVGEGSPARTLSGGDAWGDAVARVESELDEQRATIKPVDELREAIRFREAVVDRLLAHYEVFGSVNQFGTYDVDLSPEPLTGEQERFLRKALELLHGETAYVGKFKITCDAGAAFGWGTTRAKRVAIELGAYVARTGQGGTREEVEAGDMAQFREVIEHEWARLNGEGTVDA